MISVPSLTNYPHAEEAIRRCGDAEPGYPVLVERNGEAFYLVFNYSEEAYYIRQGYLRSPEHILTDAIKARAEARAEAARRQAEQDAEYIRLREERNAKKREAYEQQRALIKQHEAEAAANRAAYDAWCDKQLERERKKEALYGHLSPKERNRLIWVDRTIHRMMLKEIAGKWLLSRERVRQICLAIERREHRLRSVPLSRSRSARIQDLPGDEKWRDLDVVFTVGPDPRCDWMVPVIP